MVPICPSIVVFAFTAIDPTMVSEPFTSAPTTFSDPAVPWNVTVPVLAKFGAFPPAVRLVCLDAASVFRVTLPSLTKLLAIVRVAPSVFVPVTVSLPFRILKFAIDESPVATSRALALTWSALGAAALAHLLLFNWIKPASTVDGPVTVIVWPVMVRDFAALFIVNESRAGSISRLMPLAPPVVMVAVSPAILGTPSGVQFPGTLQRLPAPDHVNASA